MLTISRVHRSAAGEYLITAANSIGPTNLYFRLNVDFPPEFFMIQNGGGLEIGVGGGGVGGGGGGERNYAVVYADEGGNATLACGAHAHPVTEDMLTWKAPSTASSQGVVKRIYNNTRDG